MALLVFLADPHQHGSLRPIFGIMVARHILLDITCQCSTMSSMRTAKTVSITLPPDLLVMAQAFAQKEHRTMSELFREALRRYMAGDGEWDALLKRTRAKGKALGTKDEADIERLSDEFRRHKR